MVMKRSSMVALREITDFVAIRTMTDSTVAAMRNHKTTLTMGP